LINIAQNRHSLDNHTTSEQEINDILGRIAMLESERDFGDGDEEAHYKINQDIRMLQNNLANMLGRKKRFKLKPAGLTSAELAQTIHNSERYNRKNQTERYNDELLARQLQAEFEEEEAKAQEKRAEEMRKEEEATALFLRNEEAKAQEKQRLEAEDEAFARQLQAEEAKATKSAKKENKIINYNELMKNSNLTS